MLSFLELHRVHFDVELYSSTNAMRAETTSSCSYPSYASSCGVRESMALTILRRVPHSAQTSTWRIENAKSIMCRNEFHSIPFLHDFLGFVQTGKTTLSSGDSSGAPCQHYYDTAIAQHRRGQPRRCLLACSLFLRISSKIHDRTVPYKTRSAIKIVQFGASHSCLFRRSRKSATNRYQVTRY